MAKYQKAFHGTHKLFDSFDEEYILTGTELTKFGWGFYFTTDINISEHYRRYLQDLDISEKGVMIDGEKIDQGDPRFSIVMNYHKYHDANEINDKELVKALEEGLYQVSTGAILQVRVPSECRLLKWDGSESDQPIDIIEFARNFYGEDMIEEAYEEAYESACEHGSFSDDEFDELFDAILIYDLDYDHWNKMEELAPDYDWDSLINSFKDKKIAVDPDRAGETLYNHLTHILGSDKEASKILQNAGVPGLSYEANSVGNTRAGEGERNLVIWDLDELKVQKTHQFDIDALIIEVESQKSSESEYSHY